MGGDPEAFQPGCGLVLGFGDEGFDVDGQVHYGAGAVHGRQRDGAVGVRGVGDEAEEVPEGVDVLPRPESVVHGPGWGFVGRVGWVGRVGLVLLGLGAQSTAHGNQYGFECGADLVGQ